MKILVAGKGFLGSALGERLEGDHEVEYLDRSGSDFEQDVTEEFEIDEYFDIVFHTIGLPPGFACPESYRSVHIEGTRNLVEGIDYGRMVYISAVGAGEVDHSFHRTKKEAEEIVKNSGKDYTIVRPSIIYHPENKLLKMIRKLAFTRVFPDLKTRVQPIRREDLVELLLEITDLEYSARTLEVAGPEVYTMGEMAAKIYAEEGYGCYLVPYPEFLLQLKLLGLSFLPPPFQRENIELIRNDNVADQNDAEDIVNLGNCFSNTAVK